MNKRLGFRGAFSLGQRGFGISLDALDLADPSHASVPMFQDESPNRGAHLWERQVNVAYLASDGHLDSGHIWSTTYASVKGRSTTSRDVAWGMGLGMLPDVDVAFGIGMDTVEAMVNHRSWSHSWWFGLACALLLAWCRLRVKNDKWFGGSVGHFCGRAYPRVVGPAHLVWNQHHPPIQSGPFCIQCGACVSSCGNIGHGGTVDLVQDRGQETLGADDGH